MFKMLKDKNYIVTYVKKIVICTISIIFLGIAVSFNTNAMLGSDPVAIFYNGVGISTGIGMGLAANIINCILAVLVLILNKKYINIGTAIYAIVLGLSITLGFNIQVLLTIPNDLVFRFLTSLTAYAISFICLGAFMSVDIGIDPWTALAVIVSKKTKKSFRFIKIVIDAITFIIGVSLGGVGGVMTLFAVLAGGPAIQKVSEFLDKAFPKMLKYTQS